MERILISKNESGLHSELTRLEAARVKFTTFFKELRTVCEIELTDAIVSELLYANEPSATLKAIAQYVDDSLSKAGIKVRAIKDAAQNQAKEDFYSLFNKFHFQRSTYSDLNTSVAFKWNGEELIITDSHMAQLEEKYSSYVATERGLEIMEAHKKFKAAAQEFFDVLPEAWKDVKATLAYDVTPGNKAIAISDNLLMYDALGRQS